jgi:hypothetical protein
VESPGLPEDDITPTSSELESLLENRCIFDVEASQHQQDALDMDEVMGGMEEVGDKEVLIHWMKLK